MKSTYRQVFRRFVPAPLHLDQKTLVASSNNDCGGFSSLLLRMTLNDVQFQNPVNKEVPFDISCPSVSELIPSRTCSICGMYFASVKSVKAHKRQCVAPHSALNASEFGKPILQQRRIRRPVRVAAQRQEEKMVIWSSRLNDQHVDWFDDEDLVDVEVEENPETSENDAINVIDLASHQQIPWENAV